MKIPLRMETRNFFPMNWQINIEVMFHCFVVYEGRSHKGGYGCGYNLGVAPKRAYNREVNVGKWNALCTFASGSSRDVMVLNSEFTLTTIEKRYHKVHL